MNRITYHGPQRTKILKASDQHKPSDSHMAMSFCTRALEITSIEGLYFLFVNDLRVFIEFDVCCLISHLGGTTSFAAATNQTSLDKKSPFFRRVTNLGELVRNIVKPLPPASKQDLENITTEEFSDDVKQALATFMDDSGFQYLGIIPLRFRDETVAHLILCFINQTRPHISAFTNLALTSPLLAGVLSHRWLMRRQPAIHTLVNSDANRGWKFRSKRLKYIAIASAVAVAAAVILFFIPVSFKVGGEAEITPRSKYYGFCKTDGIIDRVLVREGQAVTKGQLLAILDPRELDFQINSAKLKYEIATRDVILLRDSSEENLELLAKSQVKDLQRQSAWLDLKYYEWQKQFLRIEAPVSGTIVTKAIESLAGKKLKSGEPLCEIVVTEDLWAEAKVPVERIAYVQLGQDFWLYLNDNPLQGHRLKVAEIAPAPTSLEKLGSFYHVRATLIDHQDFFKPGLKGIAKIDTKEASIWVILTTHLVARWNEMSLYF